MGFSAYRVIESDTAADTLSDMEEAMARKLLKGLKERGNEFNTNGPENVAMTFDEYLIPAFGKDAYNHPAIVKVAEATLAAIEKQYQVRLNHRYTGDNEVIRLHVKWIKRLQQFIEASKGMKKHRKAVKPYTKQCKCRNFIEDSVNECDWCILAKYKLDKHITHDALDYLGMVDLIPMDKVIEALRKAEKSK